MKKYQLLIVGDNRFLCSNLKNYFAQIDLFEVLPPVDNGEAALAAIREKAPDIVLLDMIMPVIDGLEVLHRMRDEKIGNSAKVFALSAFVDDDMIRISMELGATYFIRLPMSEAAIFSRIMDFISVNDEERSRYVTFAKKNDMNLVRDEIVTNYMRGIGIPVNLEGYHLLKACIIYCIVMYGKPINITTEVYPYVAKQLGTNQSCVERNIRNAIDVAWNRGNIEWQHKLFGYTVSKNKGRPTNKEFIAMIAERTVIRLRKY